MNPIVHKHVRFNAAKDAGHHVTTSLRAGKAPRSSTGRSVALVCEYVLRDGWSQVRTLQLSIPRNLKVTG